MSFLKKIAVVVAILLISGISVARLNAAVDDPENVKAVNSFIKAVKSGKYDSNKQFSPELKNMIANSTLKDWSAMGWRGIMLFDGDVWIDSDGELISVNYVSKNQKKEMEAEINTSKNELHASLQDFKQPVLELETEKFRVRIDNMGNDAYRYAVWPIKKQMIDTPDLVLKGGKIVFEGSGGNHHYEFKSGPYTYKCYVNVVGTVDSPPGELLVYKGTELIVNQPAKALKQFK